MPSRRIAALRGVYVITDTVLQPGRSHLAIARAAMNGGACAVQLRDKHAPDNALEGAGREIREAARAAGVLFFVNDRFSLARVIRADGVHLGQEDTPAREVRRLWPDAIIGVSVDDAATARQAEDDGADYLGVGPIFGTHTKKDAGSTVGLEQIARIRTASSLPIVAIGGITEENIASVAAAGAGCAAVISAVVCAPDMVAAVRSLCARFADGVRRRGYGYDG